MVLGIGGGRGAACVAGLSHVLRLQQPLESPAIARSRASLPGRPMSCMPTGMPTRSRPTGSVSGAQTEKIDDAGVAQHA